MLHDSSDEEVDVSPGFSGGTGGQSPV